jgi:hypothetical protein
VLAGGVKRVLLLSQGFQQAFFPDPGDHNLCAASRLCPSGKKHKAAHESRPLFCNGASGEFVEECLG